MKVHNNLKELLLEFLNEYFDRTINNGSETDDLVLNDFVANNSLVLAKNNQTHKTVDDPIQHLIDFQKWNHENRHMLFGNGFEEEREHRAKAYLETKFKKVSVPDKHLDNIVDSGYLIQFNKVDSEGNIYMPGSIKVHGKVKDFEIDENGIKVIKDFRIQSVSLCPLRDR